MVKKTTQRELGKKIGMSEAVISRIVNGRYVVTEGEKRQIADALGRDIKDCFDE